MKDFRLTHENILGTIALMTFSSPFRILVATALTLGFASCSSDTSSVGNAPMISFHIDPTPVKSRSAQTLHREVNHIEEIMPTNARLRQRSRAMKPRYITVHSTQNKGADAHQHSRALMNERLRHDWHLTIDPRVAIQHIPFTETGRHADSGGPGDMYSIGIEMCEKKGDSLILTFDRTAKMCAYLMKEYDIPLRNVVPHYYWTRKACPLPLMTSGRPEARWRWFIGRVDYYSRCIN